MSIKEQFNLISEQYDQQRRQLIPCFDDFYQLPLTMLEIEEEAPRILDLGGGTGLFSSLFLEKYPKAKLTLIDLSEKMLEMAKVRFKGKKDVTFIVDDYLNHPVEKDFDLVISALSIHHLTGGDKERLYAKAWSALKEGGVFLNADQVLSPSAKVESKFYELWKKAVEMSGLAEGEIKKAYERLTLDNPSSLADQLGWLNRAGFKHVDCLYKYYHFCVFYAQK